MGVSGFDKYVLTEHAKQRISERLGIAVKEMYAWTYRLLAEATPIEESNNGDGVRYQARNIILVLNEAEKKVLTVYPESKYGADADLKTNLADPALISYLQKPLRAYLKETQRDFSQELAGYLSDLNLANMTYQNTAAPEDFGIMVNTLQKLEGRITAYYQTVANVQKLQMNGWLYPKIKGGLDWPPFFAPFYGCTLGNSGSWGISLKNIKIRYF